MERRMVVRITKPDGSVVDARFVRDCGQVSCVSWPSLPVDLSSRIHRDLDKGCEAGRWLKEAVAVFYWHVLADC